MTVAWHQGEANGANGIGGPVKRLIWVFGMLSAPLFGIDQQAWAAPSSPNAIATILIHLASPTTPGNACARAAAQPSCSSIVTRGDISTAQSPHKYFAYLLVANATAADGIAGLQCGINYTNALGVGVDVFSWTLCADLEFHFSDPWPASGGGNLILWDTATRCQRFEPGGPGTGVTAVAGYFYCAAYSDDILRVTPRPVDGRALVAACNNAETQLQTDDLGYAAFSAGAATPGYNPCAPPPIPCRTPSLLPAPCNFAARVVRFNRGAGSNATLADADAALGHENGQAVSLGINGSVELAFAQTMKNGPGDDFVVYESGVADNGIDENFRVEVSVDGFNYQPVGEGCGGPFPFDLATAHLDSAASIRITDIAPNESGASPPNLGADIDAVEVVHCGALVDLDGDGLPDDWEMKGVPMANGSRYPLPEANPDHKDVYVEVDAMVGLSPNLIALENVMEAFSQAPDTLVRNPDRLLGVRLHLQPDESDIPRVAWSSSPWGQFDEVKNAGSDGIERFGTPSERLNPTWAAMRAAKLRTYRYCVFTQSIGSTGWTGLTRFKSASDFQVSLGFWGPRGRERDVQAGTFMHELGHSLGLLHGGGDSEKYKPNYRSVMNYLYQVPQAFAEWGREWTLTYSTKEYHSLNQNALNERTTIGGCSGCKVVVGPPTRITSPVGGEIVFWRQVREDRPVDWNDNHFIDDFPPVPRNINLINQCDEPCNTTASCWDRCVLPLKTLSGFEDWSHLTYGVNSSTVPPLATNTSVGDQLIEEYSATVDSLLHAIQFDCNHNNTSDAVDIAKGVSLDLDGDGIPDECQQSLPTPVADLSVAVAWRGVDAVIQWEATRGFDGVALALFRQTQGVPRAFLANLKLVWAAPQEWVDISPPQDGAMYWLQATDRQGVVTWHGPAVLDGQREIESIIRLAEAVPNPGRGATTLQFDLSTSTYITLKVYNILGQYVATVFDGVADVGSHQVYWNGHNASGDLASEGMYFIRLESVSSAQSIRLVLTR